MTTDELLEAAGRLQEMGAKLKALEKYKKRITAQAMDGFKKLAEELGWESSAYSTDERIGIAVSALKTELTLMSETLLKDMRELAAEMGKIDKLDEDFVSAVAGAGEIRTEGIPGVSTVTPSLVWTETRPGKWYADSPVDLTRRYKIEASSFNGMTAFTVTLGGFDPRSETFGTLSDAQRCCGTFELELNVIKKDANDAR